MTFSDKRQVDFSLLQSNPIFIKLEILKVHDIFKLRIMKFIFNCLDGKNPDNFHSWFKLTTHTNEHNSRSKFADINNSVTNRTLFIPMARTSHCGLKLLKVQGPKIWNKLPSKLRIIVSLSIFIKELKKHFINSYNPHI